MALASLLVVPAMAYKGFGVGAIFCLGNVLLAFPTIFTRDSTEMYSN